MSPQRSGSLGFLSEQAPQAVTLHLQASCHAEGSGTQPAKAGGSSAPVRQAVKRSPQDTCLMVTPDWPSRKRDTN